MNAAQRTTGMVLGKFMPPHAGHQFLVEFARGFVDDLYVVVGTLAAEPIPAGLRFAWMQELFPAARVLHLTDENPQDPSETPDFWNIWEASLKRILPTRIDYVFASEPYGAKLAEVLGARFIPVDVPRESVRISGTAVREAPLRHWALIPPCVRPYFVKRICLYGPESTGKTTLARRLAEHFRTVAVPEYARTWLESRGGQVAPEDFPVIARGQAAAERALAKQANRLLVCDTDLRLTTVWSRRLFDGCEPWIDEAASGGRYDLYLVTDVDVPWVADAVRYLPEDRREFLETCVARLEQDGCRYQMVRGDWEERFRSAVAAVDALLRENP